MFAITNTIYTLTEVDDSVSAVEHSPQTDASDVIRPIVQRKLIVVTRLLTLALLSFIQMGQY